MAEPSRAPGVQTLAGRAPGRLAPGGRAPTADAPATDWLYYRVYVPTIAEVRDLVDRVVRPAVTGFARQEPGLRWFFLQYVDTLGVHLRLRLSAGPDALAAFEDHLDRAFDAALDDPAVVGGPGRDRSAERRVVKRLYEPEHAKFGGAHGVAFAERLLQLGSEAALACAGSRHRAARTLYGAAHTALVVDGLPARTRLPFLHQYAWYWSGAGPRTRLWQLARTTLSPGNPEAVVRAHRLRTQVGGVLDDPTARDALTGYAERFWSHLRSPERAAVDRSDYLVLFHHVHLMNNRLGVIPGEEVQIARLLWIAALPEGA